jgi:predicted ArsR family transcriptional regulator
MESLVRATEWTPWPGMQAEYRAILEMADRPVSLAEIGAALQIPIGVARVLVSDLAGTGYVAVYEPEATGDDGRPHPVVLERLLEGLRAR